MDDKTRRIKSKTGVNPTSMKQTKAAKARGLQRKIEMSSATAKPLKPAPTAKRPGTPVPMPKKTLNPGEGQRRPVAPIVKKLSAAKTPKPKVTKKPLTQAQKEAAAMDALMKKRAAEAKKTGNWPNYRTN